MKRRIPITFALTGILAVASLAACGSDDDDGANGNGDVAAESDEGTDDDAADDAGAASLVDVSDTSLGEILVDGDGRTLYLFTPDSPGESTCTDDCLVAWPPFEGPAEAGDGVDADLLGTLERDDGTVQVTYGDWPLYYFADDGAPGDVNGQGVNDVWFVVDPSGNAVGQAGGGDDSESDDDMDDSDEGGMDDEEEEDSGY